MARQHNRTRSALEHPFPSSPQYPPKIGFHFYRNGKPVAFHNFVAMYAAKAFVDLILSQSQKWAWLSDNSIEADIVTIIGENSSDLEKVMEYEPTASEREWVLPQPYPQYALSLFHRSMPQPVEETEHNENTQSRQKRSLARSERSTGITPSKTSSKRAQPAKNRPGDTLDIASIAASLDISPKDARVILRRLKITKPAHGRWEWPATEAADITKTLKENMA